MPIFASMIVVQNPDTKQIIILQRDYQLSSISFMMRNQVKNSFKFLVRQAYQCLQKHTRTSVLHQDKMCHIQMSSKSVAAYAIVEIFLNKIGDKWKTYTTDQNLQIPQIIELFNKFQDPSKVDKLTQAQVKIQQTKIVLYDSVKKLLQRQGDLDKLVQKSNDLSKGAKQFYKTSKKMDKSCCQII